MVDRNDPTRLKAVRTVLNGEETIDITPVQFQRLRPIIAAQNGIKLESDDANPDLVKAERDLAEMKNTRLNANLEDKIAFVAGKAHIDEDAIYEWPIRKLDTYADVFTREDFFLANTIGGAFGGFGKGGNPTPHPYYEREERMTNAVTDLASYANGAGTRAVENANQNIS